MYCVEAKSINSSIFRLKVSQGEKQKTENILFIQLQQNLFLLVHASSYTVLCHHHREDCGELLGAVRVLWAYYSIVLFSQLGNCSSLL